MTVVGVVPAGKGLYDQRRNMFMIRVLAMQPAHDGTETHYGFETHSGPFYTLEECRRAMAELTQRTGKVYRAEEVTDWPETEDE